MAEKDFREKAISELETALTLLGTNHKTGARVCIEKAKRLIEPRRKEETPPPQDPEKEIYKCDNCEFMGEVGQFHDASDLHERMEPGYPYTNKQCPKCAALAYPEPMPQQLWMETPKVLIWMEGGLIQDIGASQEVEVVVIDEDTEGADEESIVNIKLFGDENKQREFYFKDWGTLEATPEWVEHYFNEARKDTPAAAEGEGKASVTE